MWTLDENMFAQFRVGIGTRSPRTPPGDVFYVPRLGCRGPSGRGPRVAGSNRCRPLYDGGGEGADLVSLDLSLIRL